MHSRLADWNLVSTSWLGTTRVWRTQDIRLADVPIVPRVVLESWLWVLCHWWSATIRLGISRHCIISVYRDTIKGLICRLLRPNDSNHNQSNRQKWCKPYNINGNVQYRIWSRSYHLLWVQVVYLARPRSLSNWSFDDRSNVKRFSDSVYTAFASRLWHLDSCRYGRIREWFMWLNDLRHHKRHKLDHSGL